MNFTTSPDITPAADSSIQVPNPPSVDVDSNATLTQAGFSFPVSFPGNLEVAHLSDETTPQFGSQTSTASMVPRCLNFLGLHSPQGMRAGGNWVTTQMASLYPSHQALKKPQHALHTFLSPMKLSQNQIF